MKRFARGLAGAALLIAALTILARLAGFGRTAVFSQTVQGGCLGQAYFAANQIPNIVFEIVAGGALASMVVPVLAGPAQRGDREMVRQTASAMLTWVVLALLPLSLLVALLARPIMWLLVPEDMELCESGDVVSVGADMLVVFAPQIVLYGITVVLYGVLQAHRRFSVPATAPLISSLVVIVAYLAFVPLGGDYRQNIGELPKDAELVLSVGTTLGVVALIVCAVLAVMRMRLKFRPRLRFPEGVAPQVRRLAIAGLATVVAQQIATIAVVRLSAGGASGAANGGGALPDYNYAWAVFLLPWAILAVPIATSAFPVLSAAIGGDSGAAALGEDSGNERFDRITAATTRAVLLVSFLGAAVLAAVAVPVADFFDHGSKDHPEILARAILGFAPGLLGYGLVAHLGRVLYACHKGRESAGAIVIGWLVVLVADLVLVTLAPPDWVAAALGWGNTLGMTIAGLLLLWALRRTRGRTSLEGLGRLLLSGALASASAAAAGYAIAAQLGTGSHLQDIVAGLLSAAAATVIFVLVMAMTDRDDLRTLLDRRSLATT